MEICVSDDELIKMITKGNEEAKWLLFLRYEKKISAIPLDNSNLVYKAIQLLKNTYSLKMVRSYQEKEEKEFDEVKMYSLGLQGQIDSSFLREQVFKQYNLGYGNAKTLCKRLNMIEVTYEEIKEFIDDIKNKKKG